MPRPEHYDRQLVQQYLHRQTPKNPIQGYDSRVWGTLPLANPRKKTRLRKRTNHKSPTGQSKTNDTDSGVQTMNDNCVPSGDLLCFVSRDEDDLFSRWIAERANKYFSKFMPTIEEVGVAGFKYSRILRLTVSIATIIGSVLPCVSIVVLYSLNSTWIRLVALFGFNILIAMCLIIMTNAKPLDIFAISSA